MEEPRSVQDRSIRVNRVLHASNQCCGSMTFWCGSGSGSADPCLCLMDPEPNADSDPAFFVINLQVANKKLFYY